MSFVSTRDPEKRRFTFRECLFKGYADDGGMFLPASTPRIDLHSWRDLSYTELCVEALSLFISADEIPRADLDSIMKKAFS